MADVHLPRRSHIYDLTLPLHTNMLAWPGDPQVRIDQPPLLKPGDGVRISELRMSSHSGTHVDVPSHLFPGGANLDALPLHALIGPARVIHLPHVSAITAAHLRSLDLTTADDPTGASSRRLLFRTRNSDRGLLSRDTFDPDYVALAPDAATWMAEHGVFLVGIDALSVDPFADETIPAHHILLERGIVIIEGLHMVGIPSGQYELICLPLRIASGDGAPARVLLLAR